MPVSPLHPREPRKHLDDTETAPPQPSAFPDEELREAELWAVRIGMARFGHQIEKMWNAGLREPREVHTIGECREELVQARLAALDNPYWVYLCRAQTGAGKSTADIAVIQRLIKEGKRSVTLAPNHQHCREIVEQRRKAGIASAAYPQLSEDTCQRYEEAKEVLALGLSAVAALCFDCPYQEGCPHHDQYEEAKTSNHKVATQPRGRVALPMLAKGCSYLSVHEDPIDLLAPTYSVGDWPRLEGKRPNIDREHPLLVVGRIADQAAASAAYPHDRGFYRHLGAAARYLDNEHHSAFETVKVELPTASPHEPSELHRDLYSAACDLSLAYRPPAEAMQLALRATQGKLRLLVVVMNEYLGKGSEAQLMRTLTGVGKTSLPFGVSVVISDHTADLEEIRTVTERGIRDITPRGVLPLVHPVLQVCPPYDVTRGRDKDHAADILRGVMHDLPQYHRVGLLTHQTLHRKVRATLGEPYASRITLESYFGDGLSRGSNEWLTQCDVLIILGTPRPGTPSIRERLVRLGKVHAARLTAEQANWHLATWTGTTESGETVEIESPRYRDEDWHQAYCAITKAQLKQAIGRGRGILPGGIPVYVVSTEDLGNIMTQADGRYMLADAPFAPLTTKDVETLQALEGTGAKDRRKTAEVARRLGFGTATTDLMRTSRRLTRLLEACRVRRKQRGWYLSPPPYSDGTRAEN